MQRVCSETFFWLNRFQSISSYLLFLQGAILLRANVPCQHREERSTCPRCRSKQKISLAEPCYKTWR